MPKILNIKIYPKDKNLKKISVPILKKDISNSELKTFISDMILTMKEKDGIGLAAPQVGKNIRLIVLNTKDGEICMINPALTKKSWTKEVGEEGCLSVPGIFCEVKRHKNVTCSFIDKDGNKQSIRASGLFARVIQHEIDHLDGIILVEKAEKKKI